MSEPGHLLGKTDPCPKCGSEKFQVVNYSEICGIGDVVCAKCGEYIREYDRDG